MKAWLLNGISHLSVNEQPLGLVQESHDKVLLISRAFAEVDKALVDLKQEASEGRESSVDFSSLV